MLRYSTLAQHLTPKGTTLPQVAEFLGSLLKGWIFKRHKTRLTKLSSESTREKGSTGKILAGELCHRKNM